MSERDVGVRFWDLFVALWCFAMASYRWGTSPTLDVLFLVIGGWRLGRFFDSLDGDAR